MIPLWIIMGYFLFSLVLYITLQIRCRHNSVFQAPSKRWVYYLISLTWGLPFVLIGAVVALCLRIAGHRPLKYGWEWAFELPDISWGLSLGLFFIAPKGSITTPAHEHGHGIQNIYLGFFMIPVVLIPSYIRFWYREIRTKLKKPLLTQYDDVWFERSATESGESLISRLYYQGEFNKVANKK